MFTYDLKGLGFAEITRCALIHPLIFSVVYFLIQHGAGKVALTLARRVI